MVTSAHDLGAAIEAELTDEQWDNVAPAPPPPARINLATMLADPAKRSKFAEAFCLPDVEPRSTVVDPELTEAMAQLRHAIERGGRIQYAMSFALRADRWRAVQQLRRLGCSAQVETECALERVEALIAGGACRPEEDQ